MNESKKKRIEILCVTVVIIIVGVIWWNVPSLIINIKPSEVKKIENFDGGTGIAVSIMDEANIEYIIDCF